MITTTKNYDMKGYKTWRKSTEVDGITKNIEVKEAENGFVIEIYKCGYDQKESSPDKYIDEKKCWISTKNPLQNEKEIEDIDFDIQEALDALKSL